MQNKQSDFSQHSIKDWVYIYSDDLFRWAFHKTGNKEVSEDLVQDTFLAAFNAFDGFKGKSHPKTWLFSIMNNKITDYHRKKFKNNTFNQSQLTGKAEDNDIFDSVFDTDGAWRSEFNPTAWRDFEVELLDDSDFRFVFQGCIGKLPDNWSFAIQLKYLEGKDGKEICQDLGITSSNYWQILHRAKLQLRVCIEKNWFNRE